MRRLTRKLKKNRGYSDKRAKSVAHKIAKGFDARVRRGKKG